MIFPTVKNSIRSLDSPPPVRRVALRRRVICVTVDIDCCSASFLIRNASANIQRIGSSGSAKISRLCIDAALECGILAVPLEAGLHQYGVRSMYILGLQIGLNFVPAMKTETRNGGRSCDFCRHEIEFFCDQM